MQKFDKAASYVLKSNNIFTNLSFENYIFKSKRPAYPVMLLYQNDKSVIIGRNQNIFKECKLEKLKANKVNICRRHSGGGAVYQDLGNLCFSFITPIPDPLYLPLNIKDHNNLIILKALKDLGLKAESQGRNDLTLSGKKFSGSAFEVDLGCKGKLTRVLHHGTLLMNVDIAAMVDYLSPNVLKLKSKVFLSGNRKCPGKSH